MIHIDPITFTIRFFEDGDGWGDDFIGIMTIQKADTVGYCSGLHGVIPKRLHKELAKLLDDYGIDTLIGYRHGVSKVYNLKDYRD